MEDWWEQTKRHDGLIIAGRPYGIEEESLETRFEDVGTVFPVGENKFLEDFTETSKTKIVTALEPLGQLTARAQVGQPARQAANALLHHCAAAKAAHLLRTLPPHSTGELAKTVDKHMSRKLRAHEQRRRAGRRRAGEKQRNSVAPNLGWRNGTKATELDERRSARSKLTPMCKTS